MAEPKSTPAARWRESGMSDPHGDVYSRERGALSYGHLTDDEIANAVYLEPNLVHLTAAKDRIRWLSRQLEAAKSALDAARQQGYREAIVNCERQLHGVVQRATEMLAASASPAPGLHQRAQDFTEAANICRALTLEDKP